MTIPPVKRDVINPILKDDGNTSQNNEIAFGELHIDLKTKIAALDGRALKLLPREWSVLVYLINHAGTVVGKEQILGAISNGTSIPSVLAIDVYISRLRSKLAGSGFVIRTVHGFGYIVEKS